MRALLDVNVLIALLDAAHAHHRTATQWLADHLKQGWASCPLTQNGCVRVLSQPSYPGPLPAADVASRLAKAAAGPQHGFWADDVSLLEPRLIAWERLLGPRQITDAYLLALAVRHGGRLVTLDRGIATSSVQGATARHLLVI